MYKIEERIVFFSPCFCWISRESRWNVFHRWRAIFARASVTGTTGRQEKCLIFTERYKSWVIAAFESIKNFSIFFSISSLNRRVSIFVERTICKGHGWQGWRKIHEWIHRRARWNNHPLSIFIVGQQFFQQHRWQWQWKGARKIQARCKNRVIKTLLPSFLSPCW